MLERNITGLIKYYKQTVINLTDIAKIKKEWSVWFNHWKKVREDTQILINSK